MKFKLDENFDRRLVPLVAEGGHDVETVLSEQLSGKSDEEIYEVCKREGRVLLTLDLDFANPLRFPPEPTEGIVVLRAPRSVLPLIRATLTAALPSLKARALKSLLLIVEPGRIREYDPRGRAAEQEKPDDGS
jgi:predicted nuclease of predicted toxin-antitoxin system